MINAAPKHAENVAVGSFIPSSVPATYILRKNESLLSEIGAGSELLSENELSERKCRGFNVLPEQCSRL